MRLKLDSIIHQSPRLESSIETTYRLSSTYGTEVGLIAGLTGPASLAHDLWPDAPAEEVEFIHEFTGEALITFIRAFAEAGVDAILLVESISHSDLNSTREIWEESLAAIANITQFHKIALLLGFPNDPHFSNWPDRVLPCIPLDTSSLNNMPHGIVWPDSPNEWPAYPDYSDGTQIIITSKEIPHTIELPFLRDKLKAL